jgi:hypothetical protein
MLRLFSASIAIHARPKALWFPSPFRPAFTSVPLTDVPALPSVFFETVGIRKDNYSAAVAELQGTRLPKRRTVFLLYITLQAACFTTPPQGNTRKGWVTLALSGRVFHYARYARLRLMPLDKDKFSSQTILRLIDALGEMGGGLDPQK